MHNSSESLLELESTVRNMNVLSKYNGCTILQKAYLEKVIDNVRVQRLLGILSKENKCTLENIPSKPNRSAFACTKYQFFLEAPFEIGQQCCKYMKKDPSKSYHKKTGLYPITGQMASESRLRTQVYLKHGCNAFDAGKAMSNPIGFWTEQDVLAYIYLYKVAIPPIYGDVVAEYPASDRLDGQLTFADVYGAELFDIARPIFRTTGASRTGCVTCGFGLHLDTPNCSRLYELGRLEDPKILDWVLRGGAFDERGLWNPKAGCGYWFILEWCNQHGTVKYDFPNREYYIRKYSTDETDKHIRRDYVL